jgi:hypothetical protein
MAVTHEGGEVTSLDLDRVGHAWTKVAKLEKFFDLQDYLEFYYLCFKINIVIFNDYRKKLCHNDIFIDKVERQSNHSR